ncbi:MAG: hypothetical protein QOE41_4573 [Mycobacterium sp.]|jgi:hypothetical protein|nr:hypothetical protein [Mycobacterium sp.]MDT5135262.1 hypothetical protein [Mycobacterium sp.]
MASDSVVQVRFGGPDNVLEVEVGTVEIDVPRSVGYFGGLAVAVGIGLIEPPLALFIAAVPVFKALTNTALPAAVRVVGEVLEGAAKPVGSDADGVVQLTDQRQSDTKVIKAAPKAAAKRRATSRTPSRRAAKRTPARRAAARSTQ